MRQVCCCFSAPAAFFGFRKNDYRSMRIITDDLYARLVRHFLKDEKVALFQDLVMSETVKDSESDTQEDNTGGDNEHDE